MANPYEVWDTRRSLGVYRDVEPAYQYWTPWFTNQVNSEEEYIDFEKLPAQRPILAPFVMPMGRGKPVYRDQVTAMRVRPAYVKVEDTIDPLMPLRKRAGIDSPFLDENQLSPEQRINAIRTQMTIAHVQSIQRTWDWMAARAIIDGQVTVSGEGYPETLVDFRRDASHTVVLTSGNRWGDSGVSIFDFLQEQVDKMVGAEFGAVPTRLTMGGGVWAVLRKDPEFEKHMDTRFRGERATIERGLVSGEKVFKVGDMTIGGESGQIIELWVNNDTYIDAETGATARYLENNAIVLTGTPDSVNGYRCFGRIIDRRAGYRPIPIFPRNYLTGNDPEVEKLSHKSSPLMVPLNPNATLKATVVA